MFTEFREITEIKEISKKQPKVNEELLKESEEIIKKYGLLTEEEMNKSF
jgi:hypothetical protein